eukprot:CAMPEP_0180128496 /NCGR_PEP_ID=MMETSP0986-20121125/6789_1 /TAXON_ID=697907 /ORGANISM="non described non described, Strain CCMP2293" /LENGTH=154 /DNA_ID=CAMNT_0022068053 /DNA_START=198 /DNA_END=662 /DNA_ORIENTATION=+
MQCQVGLYFLSNSFLMYAAISFSMLYFSIACAAQSMASCCMSSANSDLHVSRNLQRHLSTPTGSQQRPRQKLSSALAHHHPRAAGSDRAFDRAQLHDPPTSLRAAAPPRESWTRPGSRTPPQRSNGGSQPWGAEPPRKTGIRAGIRDGHLPLPA